MENSISSNNEYCSVCGNPKLYPDKPCLYCSDLETGETIEYFRKRVKSRDDKYKETKPLFNKLAIIFFIFSVISFIAISQLDTNTSVPIKTALSKNGGIVGPVDIQKDNTVCIIKSYQDVGLNQSSFVTGNVLDENKEYLFGFGKDLWNEEGYDDGYWHETENNYETRVTFPIKGKYYFEFETEATDSNQISDMYVEIVQKQASSLIFQWFGWLGLIAAGIFFVMANPQILEYLGD